jgi:hypothetical protein
VDRPSAQGGQPPGSSRNEPAASGAITGIVVDGTTDAPIADAVVYLSAPGTGPAGQPPRQLTDARGRFAFTHVPAGDSYTIAASKAGYLTLGFGPPEAAADKRRVLSLAEGEWLSAIRVALWRPGVVGGTVRDEAGEPVVGAQVRLVSRIHVAGHSYLAAGPLTHTNDLGQYRFAGVAPGAYVVLVPSVQTVVPASLPVRPQPATAAADQLLAIDSQVLIALTTGPIPPPVDGQLLVYPPTFSGGRALAEATTIEVGPGDEHAAADVRLQPVATGSVTGQVIAPPDAMGNLFVRLVPEGLEDLAQSEAAITRPEPDGRFTFPGVPAGTYVVDVPISLNEYAVADVGPGGLLSSGRPSSPLISGSSGSSDSVDVGPPGTSFVSRRYGNPTYHGRTIVTVAEGTATDVSLTLQPIGAISGHVAFETTRSDTILPTFVSVSPIPADGSPRLPRSNTRAPTRAPDWPVHQEGLGLGAYVIRVNATQPWIVKSIMSGGRDYADTPIDMAAQPTLTDVVITLTDAAATLSGTVRSDTAPAADAGVLIFPVDRDGWTNYGTHPRRIRTVSVAPDGRYRVGLLPAGDYFVVAIGASDFTAWQEPEYLAQAAARATRVSLAWGGSITQDLRLAGR